MKFTPENITQLLDDEVFVFGSNEAGIHGKGAALVAYKKFGAELGVGEGLTGNSYALPTKNYNLKVRSLKDIGFSVAKFISVVNSNPERTFYLTLIGCGLSNYTPEDIAPLFKKFAPLPRNLIIPEEFYRIISYNT